MYRIFCKSQMNCCSPVQRGPGALDEWSANQLFQNKGKCNSNQTCPLLLLSQSWNNLFSFHLFDIGHFLSSVFVNLTAQGHIFEAIIYLHIGLLLLKGHIIYLYLQYFKPRDSSKQLFLLGMLPC